MHYDASITRVIINNHRSGQFHKTPRAARALIAVLVTLVLTQSEVSGAAAASQRGPKPPQSVRLYVFDCGVLERSDVGRYRLKTEEVVTNRMSVACFLVAHPEGTLMWDVGAVPDASWKPTGAPVAHRVVLPGPEERFLTLLKPLTTQLAEAGYAPRTALDSARLHGQRKAQEISGLL